MNPDQPRFVQEDHLVPVSDHLGRMMPIPPSRMFLIRRSLERFRSANPDTPMFDASQGDGGASLPGVPPEILEMAYRKLRDHGTAYDMPVGNEAYRRSVLEDYWALNASTGISPGHVVAAVGGRDALVKAFDAMLALGHGRQGDLLLVSRVPWISYNWGPYGVGANVLHAPGRPENAWAYTPDGIRESAAFAERHGRKLAGMIITSPDNPTGRTISVEEQVALARCGLESGVAFVLFDWIYHYVSDERPVDLNQFYALLEPAERERVFILDGITKSLGGSNIRNAHLIAPQKAVEFITARASHGVMPSYYSMAVAQSAYEIGFAKASAGIVRPTNASRKVLRDFLSENAYNFILGQGYYAFIDVRPWLEKAGWADTEAMSEYLAAEFGLAIVPGVYSSPEGAGWIRFSYALKPEITRQAAERLHAALTALESR